MVSPRQFDVFANPSAKGRRERPFLIVIQDRFFDEFRTRVVAPLVEPGEIRPIPRLNPVLRIDGRDFYFHPIELAHIPKDMLRAPVANLEIERYRILAAIDLVFTGI